MRRFDQVQQCTEIAVKTKRRCMNHCSHPNTSDKCYLHGGGRQIHEKHRVDYMLKNMDLSFLDRKEIDAAMKADGWK